MTNCRLHIPQTITYPSKDDCILKFKSIIKEQSIPFYFVVDFESFLVKVDGNDRDRDIHTPSGFCALRVSSFDHLNHEKPYLYSGDEPMKAFYEYLKAQLKVIDDILAVNVKMALLTLEEQRAFDAAMRCTNCNVYFSGLKSQLKCRHHCHVTGK